MPGCSNEDCRERWCARAECGWLSGPCDHDPKFVHPWKLELIDHPMVINGADMGIVEKAQLRPLRWVGYDLNSNDVGQPFGHISTWRESTEQEHLDKPPWTQRDIAAMGRALVSIRQAPTTEEYDGHPTDTAEA